MKLMAISLIALSLSLPAQTSQNKKVGASSNAVSRGSAENSGLSNGAVGANKQEAQEQRDKTESMGGAPNAGGGMGTGTGAGSTVGKKLKDTVND
jgi:hypothetical protein